MQVLRVTLVILLLAVTVQHVNPSDSLIAPPPQPINKDPCATHIVSCNPSGSTEASIAIWASAIISLLLLLFPIIRILGLQPGPSEDNTLFWWFLCLGSGASAVWWCYFSSCSSRQDSVFPILLVSIIGVAVQICFTAAASYKTHAPKAVRVYALMIVVPGLCCGLALGLKRILPVQYTGWFGLSLTGLSQSFRFSSAVYRNNFNMLLFIASVLGSVGGFLWLGHPQLCLSREYKIASYVVAVIRGTEAIVLCSHAMARQLWRIEGYAVQPIDGQIYAVPGDPDQDDVDVPPPPLPAAADAGQNDVPAADPGENGVPLPPPLPPAAAAVIEIDGEPLPAAADPGQNGVPAADPSENGVPLPPPLPPAAAAVIQIDGEQPAKAEVEMV